MRIGIKLQVSLFLWKKKLKISKEMNQQEESKKSPVRHISIFLDNVDNIYLI
jgi:hypothetical protein